MQHPVAVGVVGALDPRRVRRGGGHDYDAGSDVERGIRAWKRG